MAILSTGSSVISSVFYRNFEKKETTVILKCIDQLPQNLVKLHNFVHFFDTNNTNFRISIILIVSIVFYRFSIVHLFFSL